MPRKESKEMEEVMIDDDEDEEESLDEELFQLDQEEIIKERPQWDQFKDQPYESDSISMSDTSLIDILIQILKIFAYLITFILVLGGAAIAKSLLLLMTSQLTPDRNITVKMGSMYVNLKLPDEEKYLWIWAILITFSLPELGTLVRSIRYTIFKGYESKDDIVESEVTKKAVSNKTIFLVNVLMETLHTIGLAIFVFEILPQLDVAKGVMLTNCVCLVPGLLNVLPQNYNSEKKKLYRIADIIAILFQLSGFIVFPAVLGQNNARLWLIPLSLFLISCSWWMNFVSEESRLGVIKVLGHIKTRLKEKKVLLYKNYMIISVWKIIIFFAISLLILAIQGMNISDFFQKSGEAFRDRELEALEIDMIRQKLSEEKFKVPSIGSGIWWVIGAQVLAAFICYFSSKFACSVMIQRFSFALPCALVVPFTVFLIVLFTWLRYDDPNVFSGLFPNYLFFNAPAIYEAKEFIIDELALFWIVWLLSQVWITYHIWVPRVERLSMTEKLFATPMFSGFLVEQSIALNRRRDEIESKETEEGLPPHIIACATMWHETKPEMLEMVKSLLRVDNDQCLKKSAKNHVNDPEAEANFYTFEAHIFFDDAFELESEESSRTIINNFVRDFLRIIKKATKDVYGTDDIWIKPPLKYSTPYGGRLEYTMPGENKLYVHLKDKDKIRHKKRWSQVMYMYYLLGFKLMEQPIPYKQKMEKAENTFLLALDGDIDFKPDAVLLLVDLMKKNKDLGAACGRIHPVGSGFMVWYQLFEYAIGHWLQKATEHVIGCVLCSPGCFSLFRGKALMSPNVMKRYTTKAEEARHYVQYDQGEDRWLCTLLLQRGYRVEYSAASDAYTHCPESFNEFFTQRRRWVPSTLANILDLLNDYKRTIKVNNDISLPYIIYQIIMLLSNIIGPGTILLMLVGAFNAVFKIDNWTALSYNLIPVMGFLLICLFTSQKFQLSIALVISLIYGLIMMAVLIGIVLEISDDGFLSPSALFLFTTAGEIVLAGLFHPQEILCLFSGVIYYATIPSMYLLLIIYSFCNLNEVSWGTREVAKKKTKQDLESEKKEAELAQKNAQKNKLLGILESVSGNQNKEESGALELSLSNVFKCMCCTSEKPNPNADHFAKLGESLQVISKKMNDIERNIQQGNADIVQLRRSTIVRMPSREDLQNVDLKSDEITENNILIEKANKSEDDEMRDDLFNPYWIEDKDLRISKFEVLSTQEISFWKELIKTYLYPLVENKEKKEEIKKNLKELRDKVVVTFFMLNALFIVTVFLLQINKDTIFIKWPLGAKANITFNPVNYEITIEKKYLQLEPIGLTFISFFATVLLIQFVAMIIHRFETFCHLLSNTSLTILKKNKTFTFREKLEYARKKFNKQNVQQATQIENANVFEPMVKAHDTPVERRKSRIIPDERFNSIFQEMNKEEEREMAEKQERRRSSFIPWKRNSLHESRMSRQFSSTGSGLEKIEE